jgi:leucyl aminopeptidase (aminopeptidase T)
LTLSPERLRTIAHKIVNECANVRAGEDVYIEGRLDSAEYLEMLAFECEALGAQPMIVMRSDAFLHKRLTELPAGQLETMSRGWVELVKKADVVFTVRMEDGDPAMFADVSPEQREASSKGRKHLADHIYDLSRRWIGTDFPTAGQARSFGLTFADFSDMFWRALDIDYVELRRRADAVAAALEGADKVRIRSPKGTDVTLGIKGRPLDKDIGVVTDAAKLSNLPAGEVCLAPLEDQANGTVVFDLAFWDGRRIEDLEVRFTRGVAEPIRAAREFEYFKGVLDSASGDANVIGELGIGLNPAVGEPSGYTLTDEKILGTVHLALGDNTMLGGVNDSTLHWDMLILRPTVEVDGRPLLIEGEMQV